MTKTTFAVKKLHLGFVSAEPNHVKTLKKAKCARPLNADKRK